MTMKCNYDTVPRIRDSVKYEIANTIISPDELIIGTLGGGYTDKILLDFARDRRLIYRLYATR